MTNVAKAPRGLIILDRDGVLNAMHIHPEHGIIDSPMNPEQVQVYEWVPNSLRRLNQLGYQLAVASNQPAAAKGKTTRANLEAVHKKVIDDAESAGARINSSHICWHRAEDNCDCRKPKTALLEAAISEFKSRFDFAPEEYWMIGDGVTDVAAGEKLGLRTGFLGPKKCDACKVFEEHKISPTFWGQSLRDFVEFIED